MMSRRSAYTGAAVPEGTRVPRMVSNVQPASATAQANFLEWVTPLGERLGDCTGYEIAALAALFNELAKSKPAS